MPKTFHSRSSRVGPTASDTRRSSPGGIYRKLLCRAAWPGVRQRQHGAKESMSYSDSNWRSQPTWARTGWSNGVGRVELIVFRHRLRQLRRWMLCLSSRPSISYVGVDCMRYRIRHARRFDLWLAERLLMLQTDRGRDRADVDAADGGCRAWSILLMGDDDDAAVAWSMSTTRSSNWSSSHTTKPYNVIHVTW